MKLYRFIATDTQSAIISAHEALGSEALIYSTRRTPEGFEVLAGIGSKEETGKKATKTQLIEVDNLPPPPKVKPTSSIDTRVLDSFKIQLQNTNDKLQQLTVTIEALQNIVMTNVKRRQAFLHFFKKFGSFFITFPKLLREGLYGRKRIV